MGKQRQPMLAHCTLAHCLRMHTAGNAKVAAGEMDDLASVFPGGPSLPRQLSASHACCCCARSSVQCCRCGSMICCRFRASHLLRVAPGGCITRLVGDGTTGTPTSGSGCTRCAGGGCNGTTPATAPPIIPPSVLNTQIGVTANFSLPQVISGNVRVADGVLVSGSSGVTVDGARVHVASDTSHNVMIQTDDADFAGKTARKGGGANRLCTCSASHA